MKKVILLGVLALWGCENGDEKIDGPGELTIDGVTWAAQNVGEKGRFVAKIEDYGGYHNFVTGDCPTGWRLPTQNEWAVLVSLRSEWTLHEGIAGRIFFYQGQKLFLPAAGNRNEHGVMNHTGRVGFYQSGTNSDYGFNRYTVRFDDSAVEIEDGVHYYITSYFSFRCVKK